MHKDICYAICCYAIIFITMMMMMMMKIYGMMFRFIKVPLTVLLSALPPASQPRVRAQGPPAPARHHHAHACLPRACLPPCLGRCSPPPTCFSLSLPLETGSREAAEVAVEALSID